MTGKYTRTQITRNAAVISCAMNFQEYPVDTQRCTFSLRSCKQPTLPSFRFSRTLCPVPSVAYSATQLALRWDQAMLLKKQHLLEHSIRLSNATSTVQSPPVKRRQLIREWPHPPRAVSDVCLLQGNFRNWTSLSPSPGPSQTSWQVSSRPRSSSSSSPSALSGSDRLPSPIASPWASRLSSRS